jgi:hypothetical protein
VGPRRSIGIDRRIARRGGRTGRHARRRVGGRRSSASPLLRVAVVGRVDPRPTVARAKARVVGPRSRSRSSTSPRRAGVSTRRTLDLTRIVARLFVALSHVRGRRSSRSRMSGRPRDGWPSPMLRSVLWSRRPLHARRSPWRSELRRARSRSQSRRELGVLPKGRSHGRIPVLTKHLADVQRPGVRSRVPLIDRLPADLAKRRAGGDARSAARTLGQAHGRSRKLSVELVVAYMAPNRVRRVVGATGRAWDRFGHQVRRWAVCTPPSTHSAARTRVETGP